MKLTMVFIETSADSTFRIIPTQLVETFEGPRRSLYNECGNTSYITTARPCQSDDISLQYQNYMDGNGRFTVPDESDSIWYD
jgi:hypothetical protein